MSERMLMVDLETLGDYSRVHVPVLQVGGAVFSWEDRKIHIHESWNINFGIDMATKEVVSPAIYQPTMDWWTKQQVETRIGVFFPENGWESDDNGNGVMTGFSRHHTHTTASLMQILAKLLTRPNIPDGHGDVHPFTKIWSNGFSDGQWLVGLLNRYGMNPPWPYNAQRDYRTVRDLAVLKNGGPFEPLPQVGQSHSGAHDAIWQSLMLGEYFKCLGI